MQKLQPHDRQHKTALKPNPAPLPIVLLHGLLSTPREFGMIALPLRARGVKLITPQIKGYTDADRRKPGGWKDWAAAAASAIHRELGKAQPFVLGGLCSGGLIAAALTMRREFKVRALVMMSPTFDYDGWGQTGWRHWRRLGYALGLDRLISVAERSPYGIKNPRIRQWVERDMQQRASSAAGPSSLPLWAIHEVDRLKAHVLEHLPRLHTRTLVMHAREDEVCSLAAVQRAFSTLPDHDNSLVVLENSYHMITIDNDRQQVVAELLKCAGNTSQASAAMTPTRDAQASQQLPLAVARTA